MGDDVLTVDAAALREWPLPAPGGDKEERGRLVVVAGQRNVPGAALLAAEAALRVGAGKVQLATVASAAPGLALSAPELMVQPLDETEGGSIDPACADLVVQRAEDAGVVLLGPGFGDPEASDALVARVLPRLGGTVVLDALATAYVTDNHQAVAALDADVVITVNPQELAQCLGVDEDEVADDLVEHAARLARRTRATVTCGGPVKVVVHGDRAWRVGTGNPGLGTAGSGDVHAGIVAGLLARGAGAPQAAVWAAHLHGAAGDRLAQRLGPVGYLARELPAELPGLLSATG